VDVARYGELRAYIQWLSEGRSEAAVHVSEMLVLDAGAWDAWFRDHTSAAVLTELLDVAHSDLGRNPERALALTEFAVRHAAAVPIPPFALLAGVLLRGNAWKERGNALFQTDDVRTALCAFLRAAEIFSAEPALELELAAARRGEALARHKLGETDRAAEILDQTLNVFRAVRDRHGIVLTRFYQGVVQFELHQYDRAASIFQEALADAAEIGDKEMVTRLHNNLGHCAELLQDSGAAIAHLTRALRLFEELGMTSERPRAVLGLAHLLANQGALDEAVVQMQHVQHDFVASGRLLQAAATALDIVEVTTLAGDDRRACDIASRLVETFACVGLSSEAMRALSFVRNEGRRRALKREHIGAAWKFIHHLAAEPRAVFTPQAL